MRWTADQYHELLREKSTIFALPDDHLTTTLPLKPRFAIFSSNSQSNFFTAGSLTGRSGVNCNTGSLVNPVSPYQRQEPPAGWTTATALF